MNKLIFILIFILVSIVNAQEVNQLKSITINPETNDTLFNFSGDFDSSKNIIFNDELIYQITRIENRDSIIVVCYDSLVQYQVEITETYKLNSSQEFNRTKTDSIEKIISAILVPLPDEVFADNIPIDSTAYPLKYFAKFIGTEGLVEIKENKPDSTRSIIHLKRVFDKVDYCWIDKDEIPGEWQNFSITDYKFWSEVNFTDDSTQTN